MSEPESNIIPFGKYKGHKIGDVLKNEYYSEWLFMQPWLETRFPQIYEILREKFSIEKSTPHRNEMQGRFLDDVFCRKLLHGLNESYYDDIKEKTTKRFISKKHKKNAKGFAEEESYFFREKTSSGCGREISKERYESIIKMVYAGVRIKFNRFFEFNGWDVMLEATAEHIWVDVDYEGDDLSFALKKNIKLPYSKFFISLIPAIGDDYPVILRRIRYKSFHRDDENKSTFNINLPIVLIDSYAGEGLTFDNVRQIFAESGVLLIIASKIEQITPKKDWCLI